MSTASHRRWLTRTSTFGVERRSFRRVPLQDWLWSSTLADRCTLLWVAPRVPTPCVDLFVVRSVEDSCFVICMGGASRDPIRECSDRGLIAVLYCGSHRVRMLTQLTSRNFLSNLRRATSSCPFCSATRLAQSNYPCPLYTNYVSLAPSN